MLGEKIRELRKEYKITQKKLAEELNISPQAVCLWEKDKTDPDLLNIKALAKYFNITIDELMSFNEYDYNFEYQHNGTKLIHKEKKQ